MGAMDTPGRPRRIGPDRCPGALSTHTAADGELARVRIPGGLLTRRQLSALLDASRSLGSGALDLTARANIEIRGLGVTASGSLTDRLTDAGLLPSIAHERVRNIMAGPLRDVDGVGVASTGGVVEAIDHALCAAADLAELPGKFLIAVDDGRGDLAGAGADIMLLGVDRRRFAVLLSGAESGRYADAAEVGELVVSVARAFMAERSAQGDGGWRIAELTDGAQRIAARLGWAAPPAQPEIAAARRTPLGPITCPDGHVAVSVAAPLGRLNAAATTTLLQVMARGARECRITPWRGLVLPGLDAAEVSQTLTELAIVGLVTEDSDPLATISACTGRPGCARALADVRADAVRESVAGSIIHLSGCERRCGRPADTAVDVVATEDGYHRTTALAGAVR